MVKETSSLSHEELNKRANEVFVLDRGEECWAASIDEEGFFYITMTEKDAFFCGDQSVAFNYEPDMSERPQALDYLMGKRDDFND